MFGLDDGDSGAGSSSWQIQGCRGVYVVFQLMVSARKKKWEPMVASKVKD